jgi:hypothetical protein
MLLSHRQNAGQNQDMKVANRWFENVSQLKCLGTTVIKRRLNSGNACYHSVQSLLSSLLLSKNGKIWDIQDYNSAYCSLWLRNLVSNIKGGI